MTDFFNVKQQEKSGKIRWTCEKKTSRGCKGAIMTDVMNANAQPSTPHNHIRDQGKVETAKKREEMKHLATSTVAGPSAIHAGVLLHSNDEVEARVGTVEACSQAMARARKRAFPANPNDLDQLVIQDGFAMTGGPNPVRYLLHDNGPANAINSRIVIFSTDEDLRYVLKVYCLNGT